MLDDATTFIFFTGSIEYLCLFAALKFVVLRDRVLEPM